MSAPHTLPPYELPCCGGTLDPDKHTDDCGDPPDALETYTCNTCGSDDILHDAWARWNPETRAFEVSSVMDSEYCCKCDGETRTTFGIPAKG